jgi:hypothetical protein
MSISQKLLLAFSTTISFKLKNFQSIKLLFCVSSSFVSHFRPLSKCIEKKYRVFVFVLFSAPLQNFLILYFRQHLTRTESCRILCRIAKKYNLSYAIGRKANSFFYTKRKSYICIIHILSYIIINLNNCVCVCACVSSKC